MKLRRATDDDEGPFLPGLVECDWDDGHDVGSMRCPVCHGGGWHLVPLVVDEDEVILLNLTATAGGDGYGLPPERILYASPPEVAGIQDWLREHRKCKPPGS